MKTKNGLITRPDGSKAWWLNGKLHRKDGFAYERPDGTKEFWYNNKEYDKMSYYELMVKKGHMTKTQAFAEMI